MPQDKVRDKRLLAKKPNDAEDWIMVIHPDGEESCFGRKCFNNDLCLGYKWYSPYWEADVEIAEMSEDGLTIWSEPVKK